MTKLNVRLALMLEEFIEADAAACAQHLRGLYLAETDADPRTHVLRLGDGMRAALRWRLAHDLLGSLDRSVRPAAIDRRRATADTIVFVEGAQR